MAELSNGQQLLYSKELNQASCFLCSQVSQDRRLEWSDSFPKIDLRRDIKKLKDTSIFLVLSQNCDIACRNDATDNSIEIAVCKKIKEKDVYPGNAFVKSVRKLHFKAGDNYYEANVDYILTVNKIDLLNTIKEAADFQLISLSDEYAKSVPMWRSNRYQRSALPDNFNTMFDVAYHKHIDIIEKSAEANNGLCFSSYIRAFYIWVDSYEEAETYNFEFFALLREETSDEKLTFIQDAIEDMAGYLEEIADYSDQSYIYADRENNTFVSYLTRFSRLNLDHHSLIHGDDDTGPDEI